MLKLAKTAQKLPSIRRKQAVQIRSAEVLQNHYHPTLGNRGRHKDTNSKRIDGVSFSETVDKTKFNPVDSLKSSIKNTKSKHQSKNQLPPLKNNYQTNLEKLKESDYVFSHYHNKITYIGESTTIQDLPSTSEGLNKKLAPEIAIIGSTNAGKSTFIKQLLRFSQRERNVPVSSPKLAETKRLRYWQLGNDITIVDTPGFGLNQPDCVNKTLIPYLASRKNLKHVVLLIAVNQTDKNLETFTGNHVKILKLLSDFRGDSYSIVLNKVDLFGDGKVESAKAVYDMSRLVYAQKLGDPEIFVTSGKRGDGMALMRSLLLEKVGYFEKNKMIFERRDADSMKIFRKKR